MKVREIVPGLHWVGVAHPDLKIFDDLLPTRHGTTYNSYLVRGEKAAVVDTVEAPFAAAYLDNLRELVDPAQIEYIVLNHTEPDHSGALARLLEAAPRARVLATRPALHYLKDMLHAPFPAQAVGEGQEVDLGGRTLRFIMAPFLHWPDTMFTYLARDRALFTCDAFGAHYCGRSIFDDECEPFDDEFRLYYEGIMRPFRDYVLEATAKIEPLAVDMICPSHGPILRRDAWKKVRQYKEWATLPASDKPVVAIFYASAHGNTKMLVDAVAQGVTEGGGEAEVLHITEADWLAQRGAMERACGLMFACPTVHRDVPKPMWETLAWLSTVKLSARCASVFGSFGWSGEARKMIVARLESLRIRVFDDAPRVKFTPTEDNLAAFRQYARRFVERVCECR